MPTRLRHDPARVRGRRDLPSFPLFAATSPVIVVAAAATLPSSPADGAGGGTATAANANAAASSVPLAASCQGARDEELRVRVAVHVADHVEYAHRTHDTAVDLVVCNVKR